MDCGEKRDTYSRDLADCDGNRAGEDDDGATGYQRDGWSDIEVCRPQWEEVFLANVGLVVDPQCLGRSTNDNESGQECQDSETKAC